MRNAADLPVTVGSKAELLHLPGDFGYKLWHLGKNKGKAEGEKQRWIN